MVLESADQPDPLGSVRANGTLSIMNGNNVPAKGELRNLQQYHRPKGAVMAKYGKKAPKKVEKTMRERKKGTLKSGRSGKKVKSRKQAIAIGLSKARKAGAKVPPKKSSKKKE
jgi:hypothetical protein